VLSYINVMLLTGVCILLTLLVCVIATIRSKVLREKQFQTERLQQLALVTEQRDEAAEERQQLRQQIGELESRLVDAAAENEKLSNEASQYVVFKEPADINSFIGSILAEFNSTLAHRNIRLSYEPAEGFTSVLVDHYLLDRMVFLLLSNAIDATAKGGEIGIRVKLDAGRMSVSVRDGRTGGTAKHDLPSSPVNNAMALVKRLAELHGGSVILHSRSDGGITTSINIDAAAAGLQSIGPTGFGLSRVVMHSADDSLQRLQRVLSDRGEELAIVNEELRWLTRELQIARRHALAASDAKAQFLANMSHEIRTPLNGLIVTSELLLDSGLNELQIDFVQICRESAFALLDTINDVLDFSRMEDQQLSLDLMEFDTLSLVEGAAQLLSGRAQAKKISLMTHVAPEVPRRLFGDPARLRQVLINLIGNGIKFTDSGEVVCRVSLENLTTARAVLRFVVADTGIGLPEDLAQTLFEPFAQLDTSVTRKYAGTGLGLSIARRLIELMGGKIGVASAEGRGATFWFTVPFEYHRAEPMAHFTDSLKNMRILVVDGRRGSQSIVLDYARSWGLHCTAVEGGNDALVELRRAFMDKEPFDLAVVDFDIRDVHPFAFARYIRTSDVHDCRLVLLTASDEEGRGARALKCGFHAYLTKPVRQSDLFDCLANLTLCAQVYRGPARFEEIGVGGRVRVTSEQIKVAKESAESGKKLVLVVEDNLINQRVARLQLEEFGYHVDVVNNGAEAIEAIEHLEYDIVLMDCAMPVMDGYEATRRIRKMDALAGKRTKIIALTAHSLIGDREKCLACGMDDYLSKPVSAAQLKETLERWSKKTAADSPAAIQAP
jgi:signal transduction histidine kinase/DNA-binding response OmpR family regulator